MTNEHKTALLQLLEPCQVTEDEFDRATSYGNYGYNVDSILTSLSRQHADTVHEVGVAPGAQKGRDRLAQLADSLDQFPAQQFAFSSVMRRPRQDCDTVGCGTVGCAMGWLPVLVPGIFSRQNLVNVIHDLVAHNVDISNLCVLVEIHEGYGSRTVNLLDYQLLAHHVFGISTADANDLFTPANVLRAVHDDRSRFNVHAKPADVALRIRHYLATGKVLKD